MRKVTLEQGTKEWHDFRATHRNASESPSVLGVSPWYPKTHIQLARVKRGVDAIEDNPAMKHGRDNEQRARAWLENYLQMPLQPWVVVDDDDVYACSLDGLTFAEDCIIEIKAPPNGRLSSLYLSITEDNKIPEHYIYQVQHQLMVSGAKKCIFAVYDGTECLMRDVFPDPEVWTHIRNGWDEFWPLMTQEEAPEEYVQRADEAWVAKAAEYLTAKAEHAAAEQKLGEAKMDLEIMADKKNSEGAGVRVKRVQRVGNVNYKAVPELKGVDLEQYRGKPSVFYQVEAIKEKKS